MKKKVSMLLSFLVVLLLIDSTSFMYVFAEVTDKENNGQMNSTEDVVEENSLMMEDAAGNALVGEVTKEDEQSSQNDSTIEETVSYQLGDRAEELIDIKNKLNHIGFSGILETNYFGDYTQRKVKEFQAYYGLNETGAIDQETRHYLDAVYASPQLGDRDDKVILYKEQLNISGFGGIIVSNYVGGYTAERIKDFQRYYGLIVNGIFDTVTINKLNDIASSELQVGDRSPRIADYKNLLRQFGFLITDNTDQFTDELKSELLTLQRIFDLEENGKIDQSTAELITTLNRPIQRFDRDARLIEIKQRLNQLDFGGIIVSNYYGDYTHRQVKAFQSAYGMKTTGIIDGNLIVKLYRLTDGIMQGDTNNRLIEIKEQLNNLGFGPIIVTAYFGEYMESQVKAFQEVYQLPVTGILNEKTINLIEHVFNQPLRKGSRSVELLTIKQEMNQLGFSGILVTTYFGEYFESKVKEFQKYYELNVTGVIDSKTRDIIKQEVNAPKLGDRHIKVNEMKQGLNRLGFSGIIESTYFGTYTAKQLRAFQEYYNLTVNGIYDSRTEEMMKRVLDSSIQLGRTHPSISKLKEDLDRVGYGGILVTDYMGSFSEKKLKAFQRDYHLPVSGIGDPQTLKVLNAAVMNKIARNPGYVVNGYQVYSYKEMVQDIERLSFLYPNLISTKIIGQSVDGRNLYAIKLGNGSKEIFFNGSHHAREHMTTNVLMKMIDTYANRYVNMKSYDGYNVRSLLNQVSIWFVPMVNPDGVMLVQEGPSSAKNPDQVRKLNNGSSNFKRWKANINGVDLNRQYPYLWTTIRNAAITPGFENYKGQKPLQEPEVMALYAFTNAHKFKAAVAYHSTGEVIYTRYGFDGNTKRATESVGRLTGYTPINLQYDMSGGGYTDWFVTNKKTIGMTIEIAPLLVGEPVPLYHWSRVWNDNRSVGLHLARYVVNNGL
jgi:peptidoglycan hydrolase-like protein with peptidoglycan-binding domain